MINKERFSYISKLLEQSGPFAPPQFEPGSDVCFSNGLDYRNYLIHITFTITGT